MLLKKKEEGTKRRKRKDIDIINDNDDIIAQLLQDMKQAADVSSLFVEMIMYLYAWGSIDSQLPVSNYIS